MYLRLAFAVAAHLEPDVLVVDEILAVGDAEFQSKCIGRMQEAEEEGRTLIFVSHDLEALSRICQRSIWMDSGTIRDSGPTSSIIRDYLTASLRSQDAAGHLVETGVVTVHSLRVLPADEHGGSLLMRGDQIRLELEFDVTEDLPGLDLALIVTTRTGVRVLDEMLSDRLAGPLSRGRYRVSLSVPALLNVGDYVAGLWFGTPHEDLLDLPLATPFTVHGTDLDRPQRILILASAFVVDRLDPP
jgi:ABC-2 type transport system ATP-binding protein/lipopolysaccharide transport system ATP-binding protein